jgi:translocator protein
MGRRSRHAPDPTDDDDRGVRLSRNRLAAATATALTAVTGGLATDPGSAWFRQLRTPPWYPPPATFGIVWTTLYAGVAWAGGEVLDRAGTERAAFARAGALNLALNAGWPPLFFRARRPWAAAGECAVLAVSSADLVRRAARVSGPAAATLGAYTAWTAFATALSAAIARRNQPLSPAARAPGR